MVVSNPTLTLTLTFGSSATYCKRRIESSHCNLQLTPNRGFPVQLTANAEPSLPSATYYHNAESSFPTVNYCYNAEAGIPSATYC